MPGALRLAARVCERGALSRMQLARAIFDVVGGVECRGGVYAGGVVISGAEDGRWAL